jgi:hypothetical protein
MLRPNFARSVSTIAAVGLLAAAALLACGLLPAGTQTATPPATAAPATAAATFAPSAAASATPSLAPAVGPTSAPATTGAPAGTPDPLAGAVLKLDDLPAGFTALTADDRARLHFSDDEIIAAYSNALAASQMHNVAGFASAGAPNYQVVLAYLFYPLSPLQQAGVDLTLSDPALFQKAFVKGAGQTGQAAGAKVTAKPLAGMDKFGDRSAGAAAVVTTADGQTLHLDVVAVRRGNVFEVYNSVYPDKAKTPESLADMVKVLDPRVAAVKP